MAFGIEEIITVAAIIMTILLLAFGIDWQYFREWVIIYLFKTSLDGILGNVVVNIHLIEYPVRLLPQYFKTSILFEILVFPVMCILYNQVTKEKDIRFIVFYALLFSAGITMIEYPIERYTTLINYLNWSWFTTFYTLTLTFLASKCFIAFYRWGCSYFSGDKALEATENIIREPNLANQQLGDLLERLSICCFTLDKELRFTYANNQAERAINLTRDKFLGQCIFNIYPTDAPNDWQLAYDGVLKEQKPFHGKLFDEFSRKWYQVSLYPSPNGGITGYFRDSDHPQKPYRKPQHQRLLQVENYVID